MRNLVRGLLAAVLLAALPLASNAALFVGVSVDIAPPALPVYVQPPCPAAGYLWVPGYWAWADDDYYWVPGTWAQAARPSAGELRAVSERHVGLTPVQRQHEQKARGDTTLRASVNGGRPPIAATPRPAAFSGRGVVAARGAAAAGAAHPAGPAHVAAMNRTDRPSQAQRPAMSDRAGGPQADRPPQAQRPAMSNRAGGPQADRPPQAQRPAMSNRGGGPPTERPPQAQRP